MAAGVDIEGGLSIHATNADTVKDLSGLFDNAAVSAGDGLGASIDGLAGQGSHGQVIVGGGITVGPNVGGSVSATVTNTNVNPITRLW